MPSFLSSSSTHVRCFCHILSLCHNKNCQRYVILIRHEQISQFLHISDVFVTFCHYVTIKTVKFDSERFTGTDLSVFPDVRCFVKFYYVTIRSVKIDSERFFIFIQTGTDLTDGQCFVKFYYVTIKSVKIDSERFVIFNNTGTDLRDV